MLLVATMMCLRNGSSAVSSVHTMLLRMQMLLAMAHWRTPLLATFPYQKQYTQNWISHKELRERGLLTADGKVNVDGRNFIIFMSVIMMLPHGYHKERLLYGTTRTVENCL